MFRLSALIRIASSFAFSFVLAFASLPAHAESAAPLRSNAAATTKATFVAPHASSAVRGFDVLASAGWGASTGTIVDLELAQYGATFGLDVGYTWLVGFRLAAYFNGSLGGAVFQHRDPLIGREYDFTADSSSQSGGLSIGWDVPLDWLVLRYSLSLGVTSMHWDFRDVPANAVRFDAKNPSVGVHLAPGVTLLHPYRWFEAGVGFDYFAQVKDTIPSGFVGKLVVGVRP